MRILIFSVLSHKAALDALKFSVYKVGLCTAPLSQGLLSKILLPELLVCTASGQLITSRFCSSIPNLSSLVNQSSNDVTVLAWQAILHQYMYNIQLYTT